MSSHRRSRSPSPEEDSLLHVANLTRNVTAAHLEEIFSSFGTVRRVELAVDDSVNLSKGWAHIEYHLRKDAEDAMVYMNGGQLDGNELRVSFVLVKARKVSARAARSRSPPPMSRDDRRSPERRGATRYDDRRGDDRGYAPPPRHDDRRGGGGRGGYRDDDRRPRSRSRDRNVRRRDY